jgi:fido (protein-threonine AMPylation protein)
VEILEGATPHPDEQELQDILSEAMSDIHDMDTTTTDFAKACVKKLQELKIIP